MLRTYFPPAPARGDAGYYIQRGATLSTYRLLAVHYANLAAAVAQTIDTLIAVPFIVGLGATLDRIAFNVTTLAAGSSARVGVYRATSPRSFYPAGLVVDGGSISTATTGWKEATINTPLRPGLYWATYLAGVLAPTVSVLTATGSHGPPAILGWNSSLVSMNTLRVALAFAALPSTFPGGAALNASGATAIWGRFSA